MNHHESSWVIMGHQESLGIGTGHHVANTHTPHLMSVSPKLRLPPPPAPLPNTHTQQMQVHHAIPGETIVLDTLSGWGMNGSLVTLVPLKPLFATSSSPTLDASSSSSSLSSRAVASIVVGCITGATLLVGGGMLVLRCGAVASIVVGCITGAALLVGGGMVVLKYGGHRAW